MPSGSPRASTSSAVPSARPGPRTRHRVAHRGYSAVAPENTLPAFAAAVRAGATLVEFDVRTTADGVPVVIHDRTLERTTTGSGPVWEHPLAALAGLDAGGWFSPAYANVGIPTLAATLDLLGASDVGLLVEIKPPADRAQVKTIVEQLYDRGVASRTVLQSFDPTVVDMIRSAAPDVPRGLLRMSLDEDTAELARSLDATYCNPPCAAVLTAPDALAALAAGGIAVMPWTANDLEQWSTLLEAGVAGLITDRVGELTGWTSARP